MSTPTLNRPTQAPAPKAPSAQTKRRGGSITTAVIGIAALASFGFAVTYEEPAPESANSSTVASVSTIQETPTPADPTAAAPADNGSDSIPDSAATAPETESTDAAVPDTSGSLPTIAEHKSSMRYLRDLTGGASEGDAPVRDMTAIAGVTPGETLKVTKSDTGEDAACTLGALASYRGETVAITAGHCGAEGSQYAESDSAGSWKRLGQSVAVENPGNTDRAYTEGLDYSILSTAASAGDFDTRIGGKYTVTGIADPDDIQPGDRVCKFGSRTGETCGEAIAATDDYFRAGVYSVGGDSGSPAYIKTGPNTVQLIGFLSSSPGHSDFVTDFTLAGPLFSKYGLSI